MSFSKERNENRGVGFFEHGKGGSERQGKSWFFGIGINHYRSSFINLNNAKKDVEDILNLCVERYHIDHHITLYNGQATRESIVDQLQNLDEELGSEDKIIIYYAGHGFLDRKDRGYWIPSDGEAQRVSTFVPNSTIKQLIAGFDAKHILLISDSCFSGSLLTRDSGYAHGTMEELEKDRSRWVVSSGRQREKVADGKPGENSPFAASILKVLRDNADPAVNAGLLFDKVIKLTGFKYRQLPQAAPLFEAGHEGGQYIFHLRDITKLSPETPRLESLNLGIYDGEGRSLLQTDKIKPLPDPPQAEEKSQVGLEQGESILDFLNRVMPLPEESEPLQAKKPGSQPFVLGHEEISEKPRTGLQLIGLVFGLVFAMYLLTVSPIPVFTIAGTIVVVVSCKNAIVTGTDHYVKKLSLLWAIALFVGEWLIRYGPEAIAVLAEPTSAGMVVGVLGAFTPRIVLKEPSTPLWVFMLLICCWMIAFYMNSLFNYTGFHYLLGPVISGLIASFGMYWLLWSLRQS